MQRALLALVAIGVVPTTRTGVLFGVATAVKNLWLGELLRACDAFRGIGPVDAGSWHTWVLHGNKGGTSNIRCKVPYVYRQPGFSTTVSVFLDELCETWAGFLGWKLVA